MFIFICILINLEGIFMLQICVKNILLFLADDLRPYYEQEEEEEKEAFYA